MDSKEINAPITKEQLMNLAEETSELYFQIEKQFPKTAHSLLFSSNLEKNMDPDDIDRLIVIQTITETNRRNFENKLNDQFGNREIMGNLFEKFKKILISPKADDLFSNVHKEMASWREELLGEEFRPKIKEPIGEAIKHPDKYDYEIKYRLKKYRDLTEASEELLPGLTQKPSVIIDSIDKK